MTRRSLHQSPIGDFGVEHVVLPNGLDVELAVLRHPGAAAVVPLHDDGTVTLLWQHRHAAGGSLWELPAGKLDGAEAPAACALRELAEEAGLTGTLTPLSSILTTPAFTDEVIHLFLARELRPAPAAPEADEIIDVHRMPLAEALDRVRSGEIRDAKTVCGLFLAADATRRS